MSLLNKLQTQGSQLSAANGGPIAINPLATKQSKLHADGSAPGYSVDGSNQSSVNNSYQQYNDGVVNTLPQPTQLEITNITKYTDNLPG